ncbi:MAG: amidohydrolase family protein [Novosphingobium sp.]
MNAVAPIETNQENLWRLETPGDAGWERTARPGQQARKKYFIVSCDTHLQAPAKLFFERVDEKFRHLLPRIEVREGVRYQVHGETGAADRLVESDLQGEDLVRSKSGAAFRGDSESDYGEFTPVAQRIADQELDGVDAELIFPNGPALLIWASKNVEFVAAQCAVWNDWLMEQCRSDLDRCNPTAAIPTLDVDAAIAEVERVAKLGYRVLTFPTKPFWGVEDGRPNYNHKDYERLWAVIQDHDLPIAFHSATGKDPRAVRGQGGAIINYVVHGCMPVIEPAVTLCASGIIERFPKLRFGIVEGNAGWLGWMLDMMDEAYLKHHFWVRPKLKELPSTYFKTNGAATICEDRSALLLAEPLGIEDNLLWANDYPHHEGTWPHSAEAIERQMGHLREDARARILGLNAARIFGFEVPAHLA